MALIEGFRVQNYRALRDVTLGKLSSQQGGEPLAHLCQLSPLFPAKPAANPHECWIV